MIKLLPSLLKRMFNPIIIKSVPKYFCAQFTIDPYIEHYAQLTMRQHRRLHLNRSVLNQNKDVVFAQLRKPEDSIISLKQRSKCPGVIETISGKIQDQIDIVVDGKKMRGLTKTDMFPLNQVYVRVAGKQYRCVFYKKDYHNDGFLQKVYLKQYVPGQPNHLTVPIQVTHLTENSYSMRNGQVNSILEELDIICYNVEYPTRFYVDITYCLPDRPYRVGDLVNTFPPGIVVAPKHNLNDRIVQVYEEEYISEVDKEEMIRQKVQKSKIKAEKPSQSQAGTTPGGAAGGDASKDKAAAGGATSAAGKSAGGAGQKDAGKKK